MMTNKCLFYFPGEYVALYQTQRSILKQRTMEKDTYISSMARERQEMQVWHF